MAQPATLERLPQWTDGAPVLLLADGGTWQRGTVVGGSSGELRRRGEGIHLCLGPVQLVVQLVSGVADALALHLCRSFPESVLHRRLDDEEEDRVAILTAPQNLAGIAVLRYAAERVLKSAPDNIQELRERGFLP